MKASTKLGAVAGLALLGSIAANDANAQVPDTGGDRPGCTTCQPTGGDTTNNFTNNNTTKNRYNVVVPPGMAVSSGWCQRSISVSFGIATGNVPLALGVSNSQFEELCGRWATLANGAGSNQCVTGMFSVLYATGSSQGQALQQSINACYGQRGPRPRG